MDCPLSDPLSAAELTCYHLGAVDDATRDAVEAHLVECPACLRAYLATKRAVDRPVKPRDEVRRRLRAEVLATFRPSVMARVRGALARPIPLYQGLAVAACLAIVVGVAPTVTRRDPAPPAHADRIDSARPGERSLSLY